MENDDDTGAEKWEFEDMVRPVSPGESGVGLPYAPVDWPNPGDIWGWRVGYRFSKDGSFRDRFLRAPRRLQQRETKILELHSKPAVERYLRSEFPEADISAFFASFTWAIPLKPELIGTYVHCPIKRTPGKKRKRNRKDRVFITPKDEISNENGFTSSDCKEKTDTLFEKSQGDLKIQLEEFDEYLNSLDENFDSPLSMYQSSSSSSMEESMTGMRKKLSSLLAKGIPNCLLSSESINELISLSYKLQNDPNLSMKEGHILNLIQSIPFIQKSFLEAKEISSKADEFFNGLNTKIALIASLKDEYNASKEETEALKADEASTLLDILDTDQEIAKLEKLRHELAERIKDMSEKMMQWNSIQKNVMETLPKVVDEFQMANSEKSIWDLKKNKAAELEAEILARFAPLEGFSF